MSIWIKCRCLEKIFLSGGCLSPGGAKEWSSTCAGPSLEHSLLWNPWTRVNQIIILMLWKGPQQIMVRGCRAKDQTLGICAPLSNEIMVNQALQKDPFTKWICNHKIFSRYDAFSLFIGLPAEFPALKAIFLYHLSDISSHHLCSQGICLLHSPTRHKMFSDLL